MTAARGFFATWIVFRHVGYGPLEPYISEHSLVNIFDVPTTFFFILSGVIFSWGKKYELDWQTTRRFWFARVVRLYPLYAATVIASAPIGWKSANGDHATFWLSGISELLFVQGWLPPGVFRPWLMVGWFMSSIALCYLIFPLITPTIQKFSNSALFLLVCMLAALCWTIGLYVDQHAQVEFAAESARRIPIMPLPIFLLGISLGTLMTRNATGLLKLTFALHVVTILILSHFFAPGGYPLIVAGPLWMLGVVLISDVKFSAPSWLVSYGECGFTIYMIHWPMHLYLRGSLKALGLSDWVQSIYYVPVLFIGVVIASLLIFKYFELPFQRRLAFVMNEKP
jgi:peptidoglycan/LPS O-acetylase OafA/YrhL